MTLSPCNSLLEFFNKAISNGDSVSIQDESNVKLLQNVTRLECTPPSLADEKDDFAANSLVRASNSKGETFEANVKSHLIGGTKITKTNHSIKAALFGKEKCKFAEEQCWLLRQSVPVGEENLTFMVCTNTDTTECGRVRKLIQERKQSAPLFPPLPPNEK